MKLHLTSTDRCLQYVQVNNNIFPILIRLYFGPGGWGKHIDMVHQIINGCRMGRSDKVSLWYVPLLINTRFRIFILE